MDKKDDRYLYRWFKLESNGQVRQAKCIDIEFEGELGPLFLMRTKWGKKFWLTRRELREQDMNHMPNEWFPERD